MTLDEFVSKGWKDHADDAAGVFERLPAGIELVAEPRHVPALAALIVHVAGEHLGLWREGIALLEGIERLPAFDAASVEGKALLRSKAVLHRCAGDRDAEARAFAACRSGGDVPEASDRIRVLAVAASALAFQKRLAEASADFEECVRLAAYGPTKSDPAARAMAVTAHNVAVELENQPSLTSDERALMLRAADVSRVFWRMTGGWMEWERAEYRLTMSHLKAGEARGALHHAERCLAIVEENGSDPGEVFFAREALSRSRLATGDVAGAKRERATMAAILPTIGDEGFRSFAADELARLDVALASA
jgi:hypothetical protein